MANTDDSQDTYILSRNYRSVVRLNHQHQIMKEEYGGLLHPHIPIDRDHLKIADVGTGTCIWPIELSQKLPPTASIDAIDLSLAQCPPTQWLPKNINLITHDVFEPFPESMRGKYDIVHIQLFVCIVKENDPLPIVRNLMGLLKPGGYLQWRDVDIDANYIARTSEIKSNIESTEAMMEFMSKPRTHDVFNWVSQMGTVFFHEGLEAVQFNRYFIADHNKVWWGLNSCLLCEEYSDGLERNSTSAEDAARARKLREAVTGAFVAAQEGVVVSSVLVMAIGRKPL